MKGDEGASWWARFLSRRKQTDRHRESIHRVMVMKGQIRHPSQVTKSMLGIYP